MSETSELDQHFQELDEQDKFSGVVLITQGKSQLYAGAYGYASRPWKIRNTLDMRFDTASITKLFTTTAFMTLVQDGLIALGGMVLSFRIKITKRFVVNKISLPANGKLRGGANTRNRAGNDLVNRRKIH